MAKKILVADDSMFMRKMLKDILAQAGKYTIVEAESGQKAEEMIKKEKPDLTLLDIIMPEGEEEGLRVLKLVQKSAPNTKIVMITAVGHDTIIEECKKLGAVDYIIKPFDGKQVAATVKKHLE